MDNLGVKTIPNAFDRNMNNSTVFQTELLLPAFKRGFHIITSHIEEALGNTRLTGLLTVFIQHTSASLTINENADPTVRQDFEAHLNKMVPEHAPYYRHTFEGSDDMPAHIKSSLLGSHLTIPVTNGKLNIGTWQGIYLCEHRNHGGTRHLVLTLIGG